MTPGFLAFSAMNLAAASLFFFSAASMRAVRCAINCCWNLPITSACCSCVSAGCFFFNASCTPRCSASVSMSGTSLLTDEPKLKPME